MDARIRAAVAAALATLLLLVAPHPGQAQEPAPVATPAVEPLDGGLRGHPFNALEASVDTGPIEFVEEEFLVSGTASSADASPTVFRPVGQPSPVPAPYATRILVRRPADPAGFNGTVVVEWLNVTSGYDVEASFGQLHRQLFRDGYAYVGVTAQLVGATGLRAFDAVRYARVAHPGDGYAYDIFSQAVQAVRAPGEVDPLAGLPAERTILATGASQSGSALNNYLNRVAPSVEQVIDGFLVLTSSTKLDGPTVPVVRILTEGEAGAGHPDTDLFREWEIAGATHTDAHDGAWFERTHSRDFFPGWPLTPRDTPTCMIGRLPKHYVSHAALDALHRWVTTGHPAPAAPRIDVAEDGSLVRDPVTGNTTGGIRTPGVDAPTATYFGDRDECGPTLGKTEPYDEQRLAELYPTESDYLRRVRDSAKAAVRGGFLLRHDARAIVAEAEAPTAR